MNIKMKICTDRLLVLLSLVLLIFWFSLVLRINPRMILWYEKFEPWIFFSLPPFICLLYFIPAIDTWRRCLIYGTLISFLYVIPLELSCMIVERGRVLRDVGLTLPLFFSILFTLILCFNIITIRHKIDTWEKCFAFSITPFFCIASVELYLMILENAQASRELSFNNLSKSGTTFILFLFLLYSAPVMLISGVDILMTKYCKNKTPSPSVKHARLNIDINKSSTIKFIDRKSVV